MKLKQLYIFALTIISLSSCQSPEDKAIKLVDSFFNEVHNNGADKYNGSLKQSRAAMNYIYVTPELETIIRSNFIGIPEKETYKLTAQKKADDKIIVTCIGKGTGPFGNVVENENQFVVSKLNGEWKISDTYHVIGFNINFQVEDTQWGTYWDLKKAGILKEVIDNLKVEVIKKGYRSYFGDALQGNLKLVNNSNYDLKGVEILIEHFDKNKISVNTDHTSVYDIIRAKGYREFNWYTSDCSKCATQTFEIKFVEETIK
jgi:hypothetical protein